MEFLLDENFGPIGSPSDKSRSESELGFDLQDEIAKWSTDHKITHAAQSDLLKILRENHPELPKHPRTILGTNTNYTTNAVSGGEYFHFSILRFFQSHRMF